jgi:hypothetical protein
MSDKKKKKMALTEDVLKQVKESTELKTILALELKKSGRTIDRYIHLRPHKLTTPTALRVITRYLNISKKDALAN